VGVIQHVWPWYEQPQEAVQPAEHVTQGLLYLINGSQLHDAATGRGLSTYGGATVSAVAGGAAITTPSQNAGVVHPNQGPGSFFTVSGVIDCDIVSWGAFSAIFSFPYSTGWAAPFGAFGLQRDNANNWLRLWGSNGTSTGSNIATFSSVSVSAGGRYRIAFWCSPPSAWIWVNEVQSSATNTTDGGGSNSAAWNNPNRQPLNLLGRSATNIGEGIQGAMRRFALWDRLVPQQELIAYAQGSWQLFAPRQIWVPYTAAPSGAPTLSDLKATNITATSVQFTYDYSF
jgi:hypothetical protein